MGPYHNEKIKRNYASSVTLILRWPCKSQYKIWWHRCLQEKIASVCTQLLGYFLEIDRNRIWNYFNKLLPDKSESTANRAQRFRKNWNKSSVMQVNKTTEDRLTFMFDYNSQGNNFAYIEMSLKNQILFISQQTSLKWSIRFTTIVKLVYSKA